MRLYYALKTLDPLIISQSTATTNNHQCLDYIPGSAILGALAATHYRNLDINQSWQSFHSGDLRFGPCYPLVDNEISLPIPASWQIEKGVNFFDQESILAREHVYNMSAENAERPFVAQYQQIRSGYITSTGKRALIKQGITTKTAIDRCSMSAKDGSLFSYAYIQAGQVFAGWLDSEDETLLSEFRGFFEHSTIHIGRSKSAEFGRVQLMVSNAEVDRNRHQASHRITLWCLSDCEFEDDNGFPTFKPSAQGIHPALEGKLNQTESAILTEEVSRFNSARGGLDTAQQLVKRGSVLVFDLNQKASSETLSAIEAMGVGRNKQQGLGWVAVNPNWSSLAQLENEGGALFNALKMPHNVVQAQISSSNSPLVKWLSEQMDRETLAKQHSMKTNSCLSDIVECYRQARFYQAIVAQHEAGPSRSQWERMDTQLRKDHSSWFDAVFKGPNRVAKADNDELGWGIEWFKEGVPTTFEKEVRGCFEKLPTECRQAVLEKLCRYDLSQSKDLKRIEKELGLDAKEGSA